MKKWIPWFLLVVILPFLLLNHVDARYYPITEADIGKLRVDEIEHTTNYTKAWGYCVPDSDITAHENPTLTGSLAYCIFDLIGAVGNGTVVLAPVTHLVSNGGSLQHSSTTVTFNGATNQIIDTSNGDFLTDNFNINQFIKVGGSSESANNDVFRITNRTATVITVDGPLTTDATPGETITLDWAIPEEITLVIPRGAQLSIDTRDIYIEGEPVAGRYQVFAGTGSAYLWGAGEYLREWWSTWSRSVIEIASIEDADNDTKVQVEEAEDEDTVRIDAGGTQRVQIDSNGVTLQAGASVNEFSTDDTLTGDSDDAVPTEQAVKAYVDYEILESRPDTRAQFGWSSTTAITIASPGIYWLDAAADDRQVYIATSITFTAGPGGSNASSDPLGTSEWHYVYLDESSIPSAGGTLAADDFLNDTTAPSWDNTKRGWYNSDDRCIFAFLTDGSSQILNFDHSDDIVFFADSISTMSQTASLTITPVQKVLDIPAFSTSAMVKFESTYSNLENSLRWTVGDKGTAGVFHQAIDVDSDVLGDISRTRVVTNNQQEIDLWESSDSTNSFGFDTEAWYFPRGM